MYVIESFVSAISKSTDRKVQAVLTDLFKLYASYGISNSAADFMQVCCDRIPTFVLFVAII